MKDKPWFAAKRYGYGSGLPVAWQGWVVLLAYIAIVSAASFVFFVFANIAIATIAYVVLVGVATVILLLICARTTEGGWHWRWDGKRRD